MSLQHNQGNAPMETEKALGLVSWNWLDGRAFCRALRKRAGRAGRHTLLAGLSLIALMVSETANADWQVALPEGEGLTNNAPVTLTDGNWQLRGWIYNLGKRQLAVGGSPAPGETKADGQALVKNGDGSYIGSGVLDLRGTVTAEGDASSAYTIVYIGKYAFVVGSDAPFTSVTLPETLLGMDVFTSGQNGNTGFESFCLVAPEMTGAFPNNTLAGNDNLKKVTLRVPKVEAIADLRLAFNWAEIGAFLSETDVSDWDLSSVRTIAQDEKDPEHASCPFRRTKFRGTLRVPALKRLNARTFETCPNMGALEAGRNGTLEYVGSATVTDCPSLGYLVLGGAETGWSVAANAFSAANLTNVTFVTTAPTYGEDATLVFGTDTTPARQIAFHIPPRGTRGWDANWSRFVRAARVPTDDERADFTERFGAFAAEGLVGLVPPGVFRTAEEQWLVCGHSPVLRHAVKATVFDARFGGDAVEISPAPDADGLYAAGTRVTLTAKPDAEKGRFVRWRGTVDEAEETQPSITVTVENDLDLTAQFAHDWTLTPADPDVGLVAGTIAYISNHVWKIRVTLDDIDQRTLSYGTKADNQGSAWTDFGDGLLDLNGRILDSQGQEWRVTGYQGWQSFQYAKDGKIPYGRYPRAFVLREDMAVHPTSSFRYSLSDGNGPTNLIFECADVTGAFGADQLYGFSLSAGRLRLPKLTGVPFGGVSLKKGVDVSDWRLDAVTDLKGVFSDQWGAHYGMFRDGRYAGTLYLPALAVVPEDGCYNSFNLEAVELGSNTVVTTIGARAFKNCANLARIRLRTGRDLQVAADAFEGTKSLKVLEFTFETPNDPVAVDSMLAGTTEEIAVSANPPVIYASRALGWSGAKIANIQPPTDAERTACPLWVKQDRTLLGVWRTATGARKAWVVHAPSKDDPVALYIMIR